MLKNIKVSTAPDEILRNLKEAIMQGHFAPGERVTLAALARAFGTSHMPVREALRQLVGMGVLHQDRTRSLAIPEMTPKDFRDLLFVRSLLEGTAAELAAGRMGADQIGTLKDIDRQMDQSLRSRTKDRKKYLELNQEFHFAVYRGANCPPLLPLIESLWLKVGPCLRFVEIERVKEKPHALHAVVIAAIENGDGAAARAAMVAELQGGGERLLDAMAWRDGDGRDDQMARPSRRVARTSRAR